MIDISFITVTYNSQDHIKGLLDSIYKSKDKLKKEIIVLDNASQDKSIEFAKKHKSKPTIIQNKTNVGFARAVNQGIKNARGKYIFLINPDTRIVGDCINKMHFFAEQADPLGAVAPRLLNMSGKPQPSVFHFPTITNAIKEYFFNKKESYGKYLPDNDIEKVDIAVMAAFMVPKTVFDKVGLLDERFFLYYEDIEFCRRLKKYNLPIYYYPVPKVKHAHGASGNFTSHHESPLLKAAKIYHGEVGFLILSSILRLGQKWQKLKRQIPFS